MKKVNTFHCAYVDGYAVFHTLLKSMNLSANYCSEEEKHYYEVWSNNRGPEESIIIHLPFVRCLGGKTGRIWDAKLHRLIAELNSVPGVKTDTANAFQEADLREIKEQPTDNQINQKLSEIARRQIPALKGEESDHKRSDGLSNSIQDTIDRKTKLDLASLAIPQWYIPHQEEIRRLIEHYDKQLEDLTGEIEKIKASNTKIMPEHVEFIKLEGEEESEGDDQNPSKNKLSLNDLVHPADLKYVETCKDTPTIFKNLDVPSKIKPVQIIVLAANGRHGDNQRLVLLYTESEFQIPEGVSMICTNLHDQHADVVTHDKWNIAIRPWAEWSELPIGSKLFLSVNHAIKEGESK